MSLLTGNRLFPFVHSGYPVNSRHPLNGQLVSWWMALPPLERGAFLYDLPPGLNVGTLNSMTGGGWVADLPRPGGWMALKYDGSTGYVTAADSPGLSITSPFTLSAWVNVTAFPAADTGSEPFGIAQLVEKGYNGSTEPYYLRIRNTASSTRLHFAINSTTPAEFLAEWVITGWNAGEWHFVLGKWDGSTVYLYFDAQQKASTAAAVTMASNTKQLLFGAADINGTIRRFANVRMDDIRLWKRALTDQEIMEYFTLSKLGYPGILNYWDWMAEWSPVPAVAAAKLFRVPDLSGLGVGGPFFHDPLSN